MKDIQSLLLIIILMGCSVSCSMADTEGITSSESSALIERDNTASIQTEFLAYEVEDNNSLYKVVLNVTYTNTWDKKVYIPRCRDSSPLFSVEKLENQEWKSVYSSVCMTSGTNHDGGINKGEILQSEHHMRWRDVPQLIPSLDTDSIPGIYRLVYNIYDVNLTEPGIRPSVIDKEYRVSNAFDLMEKPPRP